MEEIKYKLSNGKPGGVTSALTRLLDQIISRFQNLDSSELPLKFSQLREQQWPELIMLWKETKSTIPSVARSSAEMFVLLVKRGFLDCSTVLSSFLASTSLIHCPQGLVSSVGQLLLMLPSFSFGINSNPHPYITLLRASPTILWSFVVQEIQIIIEESEHGLELMSPVFFFVLCNPNRMEHLAPMRQTLREILFKRTDNPKVSKLSWQICEWLVLNDSDHFTESVSFILEFLSLQNPTTSHSPVLCSFAIRAIGMGQDPKLILKILKKMLMLPLDDVTANMVVILLGQLLDTSPYPLYALIAECALVVFECGKIFPLVAGIFMTPLLQVMSSPSQLTEEMWPSGTRLMKLAVEVVSHGKLPSEIKNNEKSNLWDVNVRSAHELVHLIFYLEKSESRLIQWLYSFSRSDITNRSLLLFPLLCSILIKYDGKPGNLAIQQMLRLTDKQVDLSPQMLTVLMYALASATKSSKEISNYVFDILVALPSLAKDRCCVSQVLQVIQSLGCRPKLKPLSLRLLYDLWVVEVRCYPFLQRALEETGSYLAKAKIAYLVCQKQPEKHGADMLPLLSKLLNECPDFKDTAACTLALEGIAVLCNEGVIDIKTTVEVLSPKLKVDRRPEVVARFCSLLGVAATFKLKSEEYNQFVSDVLHFLWKKTDRSEESVVRRWALQSLSRFNFQDYDLKMLPSKVKEGLKVPASLFITPADAEKSPEEILDYIPGECWISLIQNSPDEDLDHYETFLAGLVREEVEDLLPRSVYFLGAKKEEPLNYNYLHAKSIVRALLSYIQNCSNDGAHRKKSCFKILNQDLSRPYPPLDWSHVKYDSEDKKEIYNILALQCKQSRSAKLIVEGFLSESSSYLIAPEVCCTLKHLIGNVQDQLLRDFLATALQMWVESAIRCLESRAVFETIMKALAEFLRNSKTDDSSNEIIYSILEGLNDNFPDSETELYEIYLDAVTELPLPHLEKLSNPLLWWQVNDVKMYRALTIRSFMACSGKTETPMFWLNDCIEAFLKHYNEITPQTFEFCFKTFAMVATRCRSKYVQSNIDWLLQFLGLVRGYLRKDPSSEGFRFLFDIFTLALIYFSETEIFLSTSEKVFLERNNCQERTKLIPLSLAKLLTPDETSDNPWEKLGPPLAEWLLRLTEKLQEFKMESELYFVERSLVAFKYVQKYSEATIWGKLVRTATL